MPNTSGPLVSPPLSDMAVVDHANHISPAGKEQSPEHAAPDGELSLELNLDGSLASPEPKEGTLAVIFNQDGQKTERKVQLNAEVRRTVRGELELNTGHFQVLYGHVIIHEGTFEENQVDHGATLSVVVDKDAQQLCEELSVSQIDQRKKWPARAGWESWRSPATALMFHAHKNDDTMVLRIINVGAEIDATNSHNMTSLYYAAEKNSAATAKLLVEHGAQINAKDNDGRTPLMRASINGCTEVAELLLARGAEVHHKDTYYSCSRTALDWARLKGHTRIAALLLEEEARQ